jgi:hypothetical protein
MRAFFVVSIHDVSWKKWIRLRFFLRTKKSELLRMLGFTLGFTLGFHKLIKLSLRKSDSLVFFSVG